MELSQNPSSANYLHPGENPGMVLVTPQLDGSNYHSWSRSMKRVLQSKNKFKFVNGEIIEPVHTDKLYDDWERCNVMVISRITRTLTTQIAQSTVYIDNAITFVFQISFKKSILSNKEKEQLLTTTQIQRFYGKNKIL